MHTPRRDQSGVSLSGLLFWAVLLGFSALIGMKLFPLYSEKFQVDQALKTAAAQATSTTSKADLVKGILRQFEVSDIDRWDDADFYRLLKVTKAPNSNKRVMSLEYELRGPFLGDLDIVLKYKRFEPLPASELE